MKDIFDTAMGAMSGIIGAIGGLGCMGLMIAAGIVTACCVCPLLFALLGSAGGGSY